MPGTCRGWSFYTQPSVAGRILTRNWRREKAYTESDSTVGSTGQRAESDIYDCLVAVAVRHDASFTLCSG